MAESKRTRPVPCCAPLFLRKVGELYQVISVDVDNAAEQTAYGSDLDIDGGALRALAEVAKTSPTPPNYSCWCREGMGLNAHNEATMLLFVYLVGKRVSGSAVARLCEAFNHVWPGHCRMEGAGQADGSESAMWGIHAGKVVQYP
jgi:hypothetical protein